MRTSARSNFCRRRGLDRVRVVADPPLPFEQGTFGLVSAFDVLEHIDDDSEMLREIRRVIQPCGTFVATVPAYGFLWGAQDEVAHHKRRYIASELRGKLAAAGFAVDRLSYFNTLLFPRSRPSGYCGACAPHPVSRRSTSS